MGKNGQGKTSTLEAIHFLCHGSGFSSQNEKECIRFGESSFQLSGLFSYPIDETVRVSLDAKGKKILMDEKQCKSRLSLIERHPCIALRHQDIDFVVGSPEHRRWFFDQTAGFLFDGYIEKLIDYRKILKARNAILSGSDMNLLDVYDEQLVYHGLYLMEKRNEILELFNGVINELFVYITEIDGSFKVEYAESWPTENGIQGALDHVSSNRDRDIFLKNTTSGPHRDKYRFIVGGKEYSKYASTGQKRIMALLLRISQASCLKRMRSRLPILLFDDVILELDPARRIKVMEKIPAYEQAFFTFLPGEPFESYQKRDTMVYSVEDGRFKRT